MDEITEEDSTGIGEESPDVKLDVRVEGNAMPPVVFKEDVEELINHRKDNIRDLRAKLKDKQEKTGIEIMAIEKEIGVLARVAEGLKMKQPELEFPEEEIDESPEDDSGFENQEAITEEKEVI